MAHTRLCIRRKLRASAPSAVARLCSQILRLEISVHGGLASDLTASLPKAKRCRKTAEVAQASRTLSGALGAER